MPSPTPEELLAARRVWRLAVLTTGDLDVARRALDLIPPPGPGEALDASRLDRRAIQAIRRVVGSTRQARGGRTAEAGDSPAMARRAREPFSLGPAHDLVVLMPLQSAEVWVLRRVDDLDAVRACRAMDCSRSAAERFLVQADAAIASALGPGADEGVEQVRRGADGLIPDQPIVQACTERARRRARRRVAGALGVLAVGLGVILILASLA